MGYAELVNPNKDVGVLRTYLDYTRDPRIALPTSCSATQLCRTTRSLLRELDTGAPLLPEPSDELEAIVLSFLECEEGLDSSVPLELLRDRVELLRYLARANTSSQDREQLAKRFVMDKLAVFVGFEHGAARQDAYQFASDAPWVKPGEFLKSELLFETVEKTPEALEQAGFRRIDLVTDAMATLERSAASVPMRPLYSLPREMRHMHSLYLSVQGRENRALLQVDESKGIIRSAATLARAKIVKTDGAAGGQQALLFDTSLVNRSGDRPDTYLRCRSKSLS